VPTETLLDKCVICLKSTTAMNSYYYCPPPLPAAFLSSPYTFLHNLVSPSLTLSLSYRYHHHHYLVVNLSQRQYDYTKFQKRVIVAPWRDHFAPPVLTMLRLCKSIDKWLGESDLNVVAVHCKAGKGRTGVILCSYMLYSGQFNKADEAMDYFLQQRGAGVENPSQRRYCHYFERLLRGDFHPPRSLVVQRIVMSSDGNLGTNRPDFVLLDHKYRVLADSRKSVAQSAVHLGAKRGVASNSSGHGRRIVRVGHLESDIFAASRPKHALAATASAAAAIDEMHGLTPANGSTSMDTSAGADVVPQHTLAIQSRTIDEGIVVWKTHIPIKGDVTVLFFDGYTEKPLRFQYHTGFELGGVQVHKDGFDVKSIAPSDFRIDIIAHPISANSTPVSGDHKASDSQTPPSDSKADEKWSWENLIARNTPQKPRPPPPRRPPPTELVNESSVQLETHNHHRLSQISFPPAAPARQHSNVMTHTGHPTVPTYSRQRHNATVAASANTESES
jgi:protein-tyrosine phosphatase